jgi:hypothetical protein
MLEGETAKYVPSLRSIQAAVLLLWLLLGGCFASGGFAFLIRVRAFRRLFVGQKSSSSFPRKLP